MTTLPERIDANAVYLYTILMKIMSSHSTFVTYDMNPPIENAIITLDQATYNATRDLLAHIKGDAE